MLRLEFLHSSTIVSPKSITGLQLEKGTMATLFEFRPYSTKLQLCQWYFQTLSSGTTHATISSVCYDTV